MRWMWCSVVWCGGDPMMTPSHHTVLQITMPPDNYVHAPYNLENFSVPKTRVLIIWINFACTNYLDAFYLEKKKSLGDPSLE